MRHLTCSLFFSAIRYFLISLIFISNAACTNVKQEDIFTPVIQNQQDREMRKTTKIEQQSAAKKQLAWAQQNLNILGYNPGNIEGVLTKQTKAALAKFQKKSGLPVTSTLNPTTFEVLEQVVQKQVQQGKQQIVQQETRVISSPSVTTEIQKKETSAIPSVVTNEVQKKDNTATVVTVKDELSTPSTPEPITFTNIHKIGIHRVAAYLAELGYFQGSLKQAKLETVKIALKIFQRDIRVANTGILDENTWNRLQNIKLSRTTQAELKAATEEIDKINKKVTPNLTLIQQPAPPVVKNNKLLDPTMPTFTLKEGDSVFAIESIECKSQYEAFVLFYKGQLQTNQNDKVQVQTTERYAMWYDTRHQGISTQDWWCIPRKRFCSGSIDFPDWGGTLKPGDFSNFKKILTMPSHFEITTLVAHSAKKACLLLNASLPIPPKKKIAKQTPLPKNWPKELVIRYISKNHYLRPKLAELRTTLSDIKNIETLNDYLNSLDPYSKYITPLQNAFYKKRNAKKQTGLGINILIKNDSLLVVPLQKSPAYRAGLKYPHYLITLNKKKIIASDFSSFSFLTQLSTGTKIPLFVSKTELKEKAKKYNIRVAPFKKSSVEYVKEGKISLIRIHKFDDRDGTTQQIKSFVRKTIRQGKNIILDLRYCPGGSLFEAIDATSLFLPPNLEISYLGKSGYRRLQPFISLPGKIIKNQKIYIWVSPFTASSAEVFGHILQHHAKNAVIVGTKTKGKCLSQQVFNFKEGSSLQLTVFEIFGPDKLPCEGIGITPDIKIPFKEILNSQYYLDKL
jgi:carboxyl-terminal processing protease